VCKLYRRGVRIAIPTKIEQNPTLIIGLRLADVSAAEVDTFSSWLVDDFENQVFEIAFSDVIDNLERFLLNAPALHSRLGIVIQDEQDSESSNQRARFCFQHRLERDIRPLKDRPLLECLSLVPSHHSVGVQIVDFCMGALNSRVARNDHTFSDIIEENINKARRGSKILGLHTLPK